MRNNNVLGIVFAGADEECVSELAVARSSASIPFGGRYRLVDFALSNLVNAGVGKVGLITKSNYQSLMDHIGSAKSWDLDRKHGGLHILPPYGSAGAGVYKGEVDALHGISHFLDRSQEQYVVICKGNVAINIDISDMLEQHVSSGADITVAYKHGTPPVGMETMTLSFTGDRIDRVMLYDEPIDNADFSLGIMIIPRMLLRSLVSKAAAENKTSLARDIIMPNLQSLVIKGYEFTGFAGIMDSMQSYVEANMQLLSPTVRADVFNKSRPIYTKVKDSMPTRYGVNSDVKNSLIADGCVIEGTVKNSILFRGVHIGKGAVVENCIIMQGTEIGAGANLKYVTLDKEVAVGNNRELCGAPSYSIYIKKGAEI